jgi:hypothetical protein
VLGPQDADVAFNGLAAARAGNPGAPNEAILADLRGGFYASEARTRPRPRPRLLTVFAVTSQGQL